MRDNKITNHLSRLIKTCYKKRKKKFKDKTVIICALRSRLEPRP